MKSLKHLIFALVLMGSTVAMAESTTVHPGIMCQSHIPYLIYHTMAYNNTPYNSFNVGCPIVRNGATSDITAATAYVMDQNPDVDLSCSLQAVLPDGSYWTYSTQTTSGSSSSAFQLNWSGLDAVDSGFYKLNCLLPAQYSGQSSGVVSYQITQD